MMTTLKNITRSLRSDATPFSEHPRAKYWSGKNKLKPYQVAMNSKKTFRFDCPDCPHNFESSLGNINLGRWCPYCAIPSKNLCGNKDCNHCFKRSFASHPNAEYWSKKNNKNPNEVTLNSNKKFWFDCPDCPHSFDSTLNNNSMCPYCDLYNWRWCGKIGCRFCLKRSFASHPKAKYWSDKNTLKPHQVAMKSNKKIWFDCPDCPHNFDSTLHNVTNGGNWCPYCSIPCHKLCGDIECEFCLNKSFASHPKAKYWSDKNTLEPHQVAMKSNKKIWFDCPDCPHSFDSTLSHINSGRGCPYCSNKRRCGVIECNFCFKHSFASHPKAKYWSKKNNKKPHEVALNSHTKYMFDCPWCLFPFNITCAGVNTGNCWCYRCKNKTEKKLLDRLKKQSCVKKVKLHWRPKWCSTKFIYLNKKGIYKEEQYQYEYDYLVTLQNGKQLIIELDGRQHYIAVSYWKTTPLKQQIRDKYKERKAREHKLKVIRILQEDVWFDKNDWEEVLKKVLKKVMR